MHDAGEMRNRMRNATDPAREREVPRPATGRHRSRKIGTTPTPGSGIIETCSASPIVIAR